MTPEKRESKIFYYCYECDSLNILKDVCVTYKTYKALIENITVEAICPTCKHSKVINNYIL